MGDLQLIRAVKAGDLITLRKLVESSEDINQSDDLGWTPLSYAAGKGNVPMVELLLEKGADIYKTGRDQRTPYMIALAVGHAEVVRLLEDAKEKLGENNDSKKNRKYCRAYPLKELREFESWNEKKINRQIQKEKDSLESKANKMLSANDIVFIHQDFTVTQSIWHDEGIIFNEVTSEWKAFCAETLKFKVPDDIDYIASPV